MSRLQPCPSCGRHVRVSDRACPFCRADFAPLIEPSRSSIVGAVLLGLCLSACTGGADQPAKTDKAPTDAKAPDDGEQPAATTVEPTTAVEPPTTAIEPEPQPEPPSTGEEPVDTTAAPPEVTNESAGTTDGSTVEPKPKLTTKYGAPRPTKKYGAPPKPSDEPW